MSAFLGKCFTVQVPKLPFPKRSQLLSRDSAVRGCDVSGMPSARLCSAWGLCCLLWCHSPTCCWRCSVQCLLLSRCRSGSSQLYKERTASATDQPRDNTPHAANAVEFCAKLLSSLGLRHVPCPLTARASSEVGLRRGSCCVPTLDAAPSDSCCPPSGDALNGALAVWDVLLCKSPFFGLVLIP